MSDPTPTPAPDDDGDDGPYGPLFRQRTIVPRTVTTARAWLEAREEAERILAMKHIAAAREHVRATLTRWRVEAETSDIPF